MSYDNFMTCLTTMFVNRASDLQSRKPYNSIWLGWYVLSNSCTHINEILWITVTCRVIQPWVYTGHCSTCLCGRLPHHIAHSAPPMNCHRNCLMALQTSNLNTYKILPILVQHSLAWQHLNLMVCIFRPDWNRITTIIHVIFLTRHILINNTSIK